MSELEVAWAELMAVNAKLGWSVTRPSFDAERDRWVVWAFDARHPGAQKRRERLVSVPVEYGEVGAIREMARVLVQVNP